MHRIGPYHDARLRAAARHAEVHAIELSEESDTYAWDPVPAAAGYRRTTLRPGAPADAVGRVIDRAAPDAVAIPGWSRPGCLHAFNHALRRGLPTILLSESQAHDAPRRRIAEWAKAMLVRSADAALVGGRTHAGYLVSLGMAPDRIRLGYDAVDNAHFSRAAEDCRRRPEDLRRRLGLPRRYMLCCARFVPVKNLPALVEACAILRRRGHSDMSLVLVGDGPERARIEAVAREHGVAGCVHLAGFRQIDELPAYYALAEVFVLPSLVEPWGLVVNEAMACGLPVVVSERAGCARELVRAVNGRVVDPSSPPAIANAVADVLGDPGARTRMGAASAARVSKWGTGRFAHGLLESARIAMKSHPGPRPLRAGLVGQLARLRERLP